MCRINAGYAPQFLPAEFADTLFALGFVVGEKISGAKVVRQNLPALRCDKDLWPRTSGRPARSAIPASAVAMFQFQRHARRAGFDLLQLRIVMRDAFGKSATASLRSSTRYTASNVSITERIALGSSLTRFTGMTPQRSNSHLSGAKRNICTAAMKFTLRGSCNRMTNGSVTSWDDWP